MAPPPDTSEEEFVRLFNKYGPSTTARKLKVELRNIFRRAERLRAKGHKLETPNKKFRQKKLDTAPAASPRIELGVETGFGIIASDCHYWPNEHTLMHKALVWACKEFKPKFVCLNGDVMDFPKISKYPPIGWERLPEVSDEIEFAQDKTHEVALAAGRGCIKTWTLGNHDKRFESRIAHLAPELARIKGVHLKDHFPEWEPCWSTYVNPALGCYSMLITHRFKGGIHDIHNNLLWTGNHVVTGHTHSANVRALTYYDQRTIWGCNTGMCSEPTARAFVNYTEDNPKNWRSAFLVMRWEKHTLMHPQLVLKFDDKRVQLGLDLITP